MLVSLADHGLTPTVLAARLTYTGAPESLQGAVAAGLLGAGSVFLGVVEDAAVFLGEIVAAAAERGRRRPARARPDAAVAARRAAGGRIPGLGPSRSTRWRIRARRACTRSRRRRACSGRTCARCGWWGPRRHEQSGRPLPINGAGAAGAALADLGFDPAIVRGFALLARTAGVVAHLAEEMHSRSACRSSASSTRRLAGEDA